MPDRIDKPAVELRRRVHAGEDPRKAALAVHNEYRGYLPLGTVPADLVERAAELQGLPSGTLMLNQKIFTATAEISKRQLAQDRLGEKIMIQRELDRLRLSIDRKVLTHDQGSEVVPVSFTATVTPGSTVITTSLRPWTWMGAGALGVVGLGLLAFSWAAIFVALGFLGFAYSLWSNREYEEIIDHDPQEVRGHTKVKVTQTALFPESKVVYPPELGNPVIHMARYQEGPAYTHSGPQNRGPEA